MNTWPINQPTKTFTMDTYPQFVAATPASPSLSETFPEILAKMELYDPTGKLGDILTDMELQSRVHVRRSECGCLIKLDVRTATNALSYASLVDLMLYRQEVEGDFVNTVLILRNRLEPGITFKQLLLQVRQVLVEAVEHQNYPIEALLHKLDLPVSPEPGADFPLFDIAILSWSL
jgi:hypothetical protein